MFFAQRPVESNRDCKEHEKMNFSEEINSTTIPNNGTSFVSSTLASDQRQTSECT